MSAITFEDVVKARQALRALQQPISTKAIRDYIGYGSYSTVMKLLKRAADEEIAAGPPTADVIQNEIQGLVSTLSQRIFDEAQDALNKEKQSYQDAANAATAERDLWKSKFEELSSRNQSTEATLQDLQLEHAKLAADHLKISRELDVSIRQTEENLAQIRDLQKTVDILEERNTQSIQAFEHFKDATKSQRDQEARRHEEQVQMLQRSVMIAEQTLQVTQSEMSTLNRENASLQSTIGLVRVDLAKTTQKLEDSEAKLLDMAALRERNVSMADEIERLKRVRDEREALSAALEASLREQISLQAVNMEQFGVQIEGYQADIESLESNVSRLTDELAAAKRAFAK